MATVDRPRTSKKHKHFEYSAEPEPKAKKSHAFRNGSLVTLVLLVVGLYFAPMIAAKTELRNIVLQSALNLHGTANIGSASLSWFSSVSASDIEIRDNTGDLVLDIGQVTTEKPLIGLLLDFGNLGRIEVDRLEVHAVVRDQDTNLEEVFAELLAAESDTKVALDVKVSNGVVVLEDVPAGRHFRFEQIAVDCALTDGEQPIVLSASGSLADQKQPGSFKVDLQTKRSADGANDLAAGKLQCDSTALPLELIEPVLRRFVEKGVLSGRLSTRLAGAWGELAEGGEASVSGQALATELSFGAAALGRDKIALDRVEVPCHLAQHGDVVEVEQLGIECELGNVTLTGSAKTADFSAADRVTALLRENYQVKGQLDLVKLAAALPETLRIREGTEITSGNVQLAVASRPQQDGMHWTGKIDASQLGAKADGRVVKWENPLSIDFAVRETDKEGFLVDKAECTSSFLHAKASGSINELEATANFDLARLLAELKQFADLSELNLNGQGDATLSLKRLENNTFSADGQLKIQGFQFVPIAGGQPWTEETVLAKLDLDGQLDKQYLKQINRASVTVDVGGERLIAQLRSPLTDLKSNVPLQCNWRGNLATWGPRLETCAGLEGFDFRGTGSLQAAVQYASSGIEIEQAEADFAQLQIWGHDWFINEPTATITCEGRWDNAKQRAEITEAKFTAGTTNAVVRNAVWQATENGGKLDGGKAQIGAELASLARWRTDPRVKPQWQVSGRLAVQAELSHDASLTSGRVDGTIDQLNVVDLAHAQAGSGVPGWREDRINLSAVGSYKHATELVQIDTIQLASAALRCDAKGSLPMSAQGGDVDLKGTLQYDWEALSPLWRSYLGNDVQVTGKQARNFSLQGRLDGSPTLPESWKQITGDAAVGWAGINLHGLQIGQADIVAHLAGGQVRAQPIEFTVSEGNFTNSPVVQLVPGPPALYLSTGPILTNVHLTPQMCSRGMKFVAPIVAEATVAEGRFSVTIDGARIPLGDTLDSDIAGRMAIRAQVKPGPVAQEFFTLIGEIVSVLKRGSLENVSDQSGALMSIDTTDVQFRMINRRIYHQNLKFVIAGVPVTTHGSVGVDESLSMVAEIPVRANLFGKDLSFGAMEGQAMQIPISGTLNKPKLDKGVLRNLTGQVIENAARGAILDNVNKGLERLLPPQR